MGEKSNEIGEGTAGTAAATGGRVTESPLAPGVESELTGAPQASGTGGPDPSSGLRDDLQEAMKSTPDPEPPH